MDHEYASIAKEIGIIPIAKRRGKLDECLGSLNDSKAKPPAVSLARDALVVSRSTFVKTALFFSIMSAELACRIRGGDIQPAYSSTRLSSTGS